MRACLTSIVAALCLAWAGRAHAGTVVTPPAGATTAACPDGFVLVLGRGPGGDVAAGTLAGVGVRMAAATPSAPPWCRAVTLPRVPALPADWRPIAEALAAAAAPALAVPAGRPPPPLELPDAPVPAWLAVVTYAPEEGRGKGPFSVWLYPPGGGPPRVDARTARPDAIRRVAGELLLREIGAPAHAAEAAGRPPIPRVDGEGAAASGDGPAFFRVLPGARARFGAEGSEDPDGDVLTHAWTCSGRDLPEPVVGEGPSFSPDLAPGFYACALSTTDGVHRADAAFAVHVVSRADALPTLRLSFGGGALFGQARGAGFGRHEGGTLSGWLLAPSAGLAGPLGEARVELVFPGRFASVEGSASLGLSPEGGPLGWLFAGGRLQLPLVARPRAELAVGALGGVVAALGEEGALPSGTYARLGGFARISLARRAGAATWISPRLEAAWNVSVDPPGSDYSSRGGSHGGHRADVVTVLLAVDLELRPLR